MKKVQNKIYHEQRAGFLKLLIILKL